MKYANPLHSAVLAAYPVGSIYMSTSATDPGTLFGGTWARIQGRFLLAADDSHAAGSTGGEENHTLTVDEIPRHNHNISLPYATSVGGQNDAFVIGSMVSMSGVHPTEYTGGNQPHNNMPPYLAVYCWQRTA